MADNNGKSPDLIQIKEVQRNPFVSQSVEPREAIRVALDAKLTREYVPASTLGYYPFLKAQPPSIDEITSQFGLQIYSQMMTDPVVYASERLFVLGLLANGYEIVPSLSREEHDYDEAQKMCDFVKENIADLETQYDVVLENHLDAFTFGCSVNEQVYRTDGKTIRLKDIRDKPLQNALFIVDSYNNTIGILTQRFPGQIYPATSYIPIDAASVTAGMNAVRDQTNRKGEVDLSERIKGLLPRYLFSVLTNEMRFNDERGHSALRAAYSAWWFKQQTIAEYLSWLSKFATPTLVGTTAEGDTGQTILNEETGDPLLDTEGLPQRKTPQEVLLSALIQVQNGSAIAVPFGAKVETIKAEGDGAGFGKALAFADMQIALAITGQYLATMEGQHQSRASSETHQDVISLSMNRRKRWLANQQRREVFTPLLRYNFNLDGTKIARYIPQLKLGYGDGFPTKPAEIAQLMTSGYLDKSQLEGLDERLGLPKRDLITITDQDGNEMKVSPSDKLQRDDAQQQQQQNMDMQEKALAAKQGQNGNGNGPQGGGAIGER